MIKLHKIKVGNEECTGCYFLNITNSVCYKVPNYDSCTDNGPPYNNYIFKYSLKKVLKEL